MPALSRRELLGGACVAAAATGVWVMGGRPGAADSWESVRAEFELDPERIHLGALFIASHPRPVREAIELHRRGLDADPVRYLLEHGRRRTLEVLSAAAGYWGAHPRDVALTGSTTMSLAMLYNGLRLSEGDELLTTDRDYYSTVQSLRYRAERSSARLRVAPLYDRLDGVSEEALVESVRRELRPSTRVLALTWVHSDTGLKLPVRGIVEEVARLNAGRDPSERILVCVDGVHGFGVEDESMPELGCDFFAAGCHKWLFGPRGTGVLYAARSALWERMLPTVPPFRPRDTPGLVMTPGGFHAFEHRWALTEAFRFQLRLGKARVAQRVRALCDQLKEGLSRLRGVALHTPLSPRLSAGIVAFDVRGLDAGEVVRRLLSRGIVVTRAPYGTRSVRATPSLLNTPEEIDRTLAAIRALA